MTSRHQMQNIIFQNSLWLVINTIMLIMLIILTSVRSSLWTLWPIVDSRYDILSLPITKFVPILVPVILACGVLSLLLIFVQLGCGDDPNEDDCEDTECEDGDETKDDPSVQAKVARKMEPVLNIVASATDVEIWFFQMCINMVIFNSMCQDMIINCYIHPIVHVTEKQDKNLFPSWISKIPKPIDERKDFRGFLIYDAKHNLEENYFR